MTEITQLQPPKKNPTQASMPTQTLAEEMRAKHDDLKAAYTTDEMKDFADTDMVRTEIYTLNERQRGLTFAEQEFTTSIAKLSNPSTMDIQAHKDVLHKKYRSIMGKDYNEERANQSLDLLISRHRQADGHPAFTVVPDKASVVAKAKGLRVVK